MEPLKAKYTKFLFYVVATIPWFFTKRLRFLVGSYGAEREENNDVYKDDDAVSTARLFKSDVKWKGVSLVGSMSRGDLAKIHNWMDRQKESPGNYHGSHAETIKSTNLIGSGTNNLGVISFDKHSMFAVRSISIVSNLPSSCYLTLVRLRNGASYLSLYVYFDEAVNKEISDIDVRFVKRYKCFQSINPFSPRFSVLEHHDRRSIIEGLVYENARSVVAQARQAVSALLEVWGVRKDISEFSTVADFFREGTGSYFYDAPIADEDRQPDCLTVVEPRHGKFLRSNISDDISEDYIENYIPEKIGVDAVFIKSQVSADVESYDAYLNRYVGVTDYYSFLMMLSEINLHFLKCMRQVSPIFFNYKNSIQDDLKILIGANLSLNLIDERLTAVEEGLRWSEDKYHKVTRARISAIRSRVVALRGDVEKRKDLSDSGLQLANLLWMKKYSKYVFALVIVQILLSILNVDWTEEGRSKNPMYINLFSDKK